ncbi:MAG: formate dehydrogenase subunit gamma [Motiliproteus sp.]
MHDHSDQYIETARSAIDRLQHKPGALLPILHDIHNQLGFIPAVTLAIIAAGLHQTSAEIQGVISFYEHFRTTPPGRHQLQICRAEACQARGSRALEQHVKATLGIGYHQSTPDQEYSLDPVYCLGNCACGPNLRVNDEIIGRVNAARFDRLIDELSTLPLEIKS